MKQAKKIMEEAKQLGVKLYLPVDVVAAETFDAEANAKLLLFKKCQKLDGIRYWTCISTII